MSGTSAARSCLRQACPCLLSALLAFLLLAPATVFAQGSGAGNVDTRSAPSGSYYSVFPAMWEGEYRDALKAFQSELRGSIKSAQSQWIDAICYHTMCGECYYHMGQLTDAMTHYNAALRLYLAFPEWMMRVQFPPTIRAAQVGQIRQVPWGRSQRQVRLGDYPSKMMIAQGRLNNFDVVRQGGLAQPPILFPIRPQEIVRCTALAMRRRNEILGPVTVHDPMTNDLISALTRAPGPPNHWSQAWVDVQLGIAYLSADKLPQAKAALQRSLAAAGEFDHPLTATALVELAKIALKEENYAAALSFGLEATYSAFHDEGADTPDLMEEAFRVAMVAHLLIDGNGVLLPPIDPAADWARVKRLKHLHAFLLLMGAENYAAIGNLNAAERLLGEVRAEIGRRDMGRGMLGARLAWLTAQVHYQQGRIEPGDEALASALQFMGQGASKKIYQVALADNLYAEGTLRPRQVMDVFTAVLQDPLPTDWAHDPMEAMSSLVVPHPLAYEHWFEVAIVRKEHERALEISDLAKRHRFYSSLGMGGRLLSLRWVLEAPESVLPQEALLERQRLLGRYQGYGQLSQNAAALRQQLKQMPLVNDEGEAAQQQHQLLEQLTAASLTQEAVLRQMAVRREAASLVFPPRTNTKELQAALQPGQLMLNFFATSRYVYGFVISQDKYSYWHVGAPKLIYKHIQELLRQIGNLETNRNLSYRDLAETDWRGPARTIMAGLLQGAKVELPGEFNELIVIPDGAFWYVPFEALQLDAGDRSQTLLTQMKVRYAPMATLGVSNGRARGPAGNTAVVLDGLVAGQDEAFVHSEFDRLAKVVPGAVALPPKLPAASGVYGSLFDRLIVFDEIVPDQGPYAWSPIPNDAAGPGNSLNSWLMLPWYGPEELLMPAYHTAAGNSLKNMSSETVGQEMFLSVCGMMATGSRTILLSRWRTGGQTAFDLTREFAQELPYTTASDAWQRAVYLTADTHIDPEREPRITPQATEDVPKANHPFFWAGYMVLDSGTPPHQEAVPQPEQVEAAAN